MSMIGLISRLFECLADSWDDGIVLSVWYRYLDCPFCET